MINRKKILVRIVSIIFFIFILNTIAIKLHWYFSIWWFDMPMHILGGFWVGLVLIWFFPPKDLSFNSIIKIILGFFVIAIGWEIFEILVDKLITERSFNTLDTLSDLFFGLSGSLYSLFYFFRKIMIKEENKL